MVGRVVATTMMLAILVAGPAVAAKKKSASTPAPAPAPAAPAPRDSTVRAPVTPSDAALKPGPLVRAGSPVADRTTIAPFPVPGDTGRAARERAKLMNAPRKGMTIAQPLYEDDLPRVEGGVSLAIEPAASEYPKAARDARIQGIVLVMATVLADGSVGDAQVIKSVAGLDEAALGMVKRMRFRPAYYMGNPTTTTVVVPVRFTIH